MKDMLFQIIDNKYIPYAKFEKGILSRLCFKLKFEDSDVEPILCSAQQSDSSLVDNESKAPDDDEVSEYNIIRLIESYMNGC